MIENFNLRKIMEHEFLDKIDKPSDLRILSTNDLDNVSEELSISLLKQTNAEGILEQVLVQLS